MIEQEGRSMLRPYNQTEVTFGLASRHRNEAQTKVVAHKVKMIDGRIRRSSLRDDAVGPLDQAHKNRGIAEFRSPLI